MSPLIGQMRERLAILEPLLLDIVDESEQHAGHAGARSGGGHFRMTIASSGFSGMAVMAQHRLVYDALGSLMQHEIHALSLITRTPEDI